MYMYMRSLGYLTQPAVKSVLGVAGGWFKKVLFFGDGAVLFLLYMGDKQKDIKMIRY